MDKQDTFVTSIMIPAEIRFFRSDFKSDKAWESFKKKTETDVEFRKEKLVEEAENYYVESSDGSENLVQAIMDGIEEGNHCEFQSEQW